MNHGFSQKPSHRSIAFRSPHPDRSRPSGSGQDVIRGVVTLPMTALRLLAPLGPERPIPAPLRHRHRPCRCWPPPHGAAAGWRHPTGPPRWRTRPGCRGFRVLGLQQGLQQRPGLSNAPLYQKRVDRGPRRGPRSCGLPGHLDAAIGATHRQLPAHGGMQFWKPSVTVWTNGPVAGVWRPPGSREASNLASATVNAVPPNRAPHRRSSGSWPASRPCLPRSERHCGIRKPGHSVIAAGHSRVPCGSAHSPSSVRPGKSCGRGPSPQVNRRSSGRMSTSLMLASRRRIRPVSENSQFSLPCER